MVPPAIASQHHCWLYATTTRHALGEEMLRKRRAQHKFWAFCLPANTTAASQATPDTSSHSLLSFCELGSRRSYLTVAVYSAWLHSTASLGFVSLPPGLQEAILLQCKRLTALPLTDLSRHTLFAEHTWVSDLFQSTSSSPALLMLCPSCRVKGVLVENHGFTKYLTDFCGRHRSPEKHMWPIQYLQVALSCTTLCALGNHLKDVLQAAMGC